MAEAEASGDFKIENVPDGSYTVTAWREGMKPQSKPVTISGTRDGGLRAVQVAVDFSGPAIHAHTVSR